MQSTRPRYFVRVSRPTTHFAMRRFVPAISWQCRVLVASVISAFSLPGGWVPYGGDRAWQREGKAGQRTGRNVLYRRDAQTEDPAAILQRMGGATVILATAASASSMGPLIAGLAPRGRLIVVGGSPEPIQVNPAQLIFGARSLEGSLTGTAIDIEDTLAFSVLENVRPMIETVPPERAAEAYARMMRGEARFRIVFTTANRLAQGFPFNNLVRQPRVACDALYLVRLLYIQT